MNVLTLRLDAARPDGREMLKKLAIGTIVALLPLVVIAAGVGAAYQWHAARADLAAFPPPGRLVDVGGLTLHIDCRGTGEPTLVLEAGLTYGSTTWSLIHDALAGTTRTCAYDRPGLDWSEPLDRGAPAVEVAERLHALLGEVGVNGPRVLVGMSAGGVYVREYYARHPEGVVGMILVDSSHEEQAWRLPQPEGAEEVADMLARCTWLQPFGIVRALGTLEMVIDGYTLPDDVRASMRASLNHSHACQVIRQELDSFAADLDGAAPPRPLGNLPLLVLSQGKTPEPNAIFGTTREFEERQRAVWNTLQGELTALSSRGRRVVAPNSGHMIQLEEPELVVREINSFVGKLREG